MYKIAFYSVTLPPLKEEEASSKGSKSKGKSKSKNPPDIPDQVTNYLSVGDVVVFEVGFKHWDFDLCKYVDEKPKPNEMQKIAGAKMPKLLTAKKIRKSEGDADIEKSCTVTAKWLATLSTMPRLSDMISATTGMFLAAMSRVSGLERLSLGRLPFPPPARRSRRSAGRLLVGGCSSPAPQVLIVAL